MTEQTGTAIVPFGKYKGRPVTDLISDRSYTDWLAAQPWFRERYSNIYNVIITGTALPPQDTPEHNKMQARFLNHDVCLNLLSQWMTGVQKHRENWIKKHTDKLTGRQLENIGLETPGVSWISHIEFEADGWDIATTGHTRVSVSEMRHRSCECVCDPGRCGIRSNGHYDYTQGSNPVWVETPRTVTDIEAEWSKCWSPSRVKHCADDCPASWVIDRRAYDFTTPATAYENALHNLHDTLSIAVELKPAIGDDYPSVLRTVTRRRDMCAARGRVGNISSYTAFRWVVLADEASFEGVDLASVKKIFTSQSVDLLVTEELSPISSEWKCACKACK